MKTNMGSADRLIRIIIAAILLALYASGTVTGTLSIVVLVAALVMGLTAFIRFCPLYSLFNINTCKKD